jgi:UDP:flavonoid glycosyltransferase YjiC (YdhE family)
MRVVLSYGSRGDVEPMAGLAVQLRTLGAEMRVCAPPDCATPWPSSSAWTSLADDSPR